MKLEGGISSSCDAQAQDIFSPLGTPFLRIGGSETVPLPALDTSIVYPDCNFVHFIQTLSESGLFTNPSLPLAFVNIVTLQICGRGGSNDIRDEGTKMGSVLD